jgi:hypothetical protein
MSSRTPTESDRRCTIAKTVSIVTLFLFLGICVFISQTCTGVFALTTVVLAMLLSIFH